MHDVVTGAFGYTGRHIAHRLLRSGRIVRTLTSRTPPEAGPLSAIEARPFSFEDPDALARSLEGADVLYNTYWIRFDRGGITFDAAVEHSRALIRAAEAAGVRRIVHISVTNASLDSPFPYFRGKAAVEAAVSTSKLQWCIVRPALVFGPGDILLNNIAWGIRTFRFFLIFGSGGYPVVPIHADDLAELAVEAGAQTENLRVDAVGPERMTFEELVRVIAEAVGRKPRAVHLPPSAVHVATKAAGALLRDVVLTRDEIGGFMSGLLDSPHLGPGRTRLADWLREEGAGLGLRYASELDRHFR